MECARFVTRCESADVCQTDLVCGGSSSFSDPVVVASSARDASRKCRRAKRAANLKLLHYSSGGDGFVRGDSENNAFRLGFPDTKRDTKRKWLENTLTIYISIASGNLISRSALLCVLWTRVRPHTRSRYTHNNRIKSHTYTHTRAQSTPSDDFVDC